MEARTVGSQFNVPVDKVDINAIGILVKSPALSSTSPITAKVAYGIAIPTVFAPSNILPIVSSEADSCR